jgi:hypothetical protein
MLKPLLSAVAVLIVAGCQQQQPPPAAPPRFSEVGRYVIVQSPHAERDTTLLDTVTGRTWRSMAQVGLSNAPTAWEPMPQLNTGADYEALRKRYGEASEGASSPP